MRCARWSRRLRPALVINAAAIADLDACERDPALAYAVNARAVAVMARRAGRWRVPLVQVSTDHFFTGDGDRPHSETRSGDAGERICADQIRGRGLCRASRRARSSCAPTSLACAAGPGRPTFAEWALDAAGPARAAAPLRRFLRLDHRRGRLSHARCSISSLPGDAGVVNLAARTVASQTPLRPDARPRARHHARLGRARERAAALAHAARRKRRVSTSAGPSALLGYALPDTDAGLPQSRSAMGRAAMRYATSFMIGAREIALDRPTYFIADIAANHDGDLARAKDLIALRQGGRRRRGQIPAFPRRQDRERFRLPPARHADRASGEMAANRCSRFIANTASTATGT